VPASTIYLDYNATTPAAEETISAMLPWLSVPANPSSAHRLGDLAAAALADARCKVAAAVGTRPSRLTFTSGATESNNLVLATLAGAPAGRRCRVLVLSTEHKSVLETAKALRRHGWSIDIIPVSSDGVIDMGAFGELLSDDVQLVSVQLVNNETGVVQPLEAVTDAAHAAGALVHTDASQALGKITVDLDALGVDMASFSSHKAYGPQGVGALFVRSRRTVVAAWSGGGQEQGLRPGTQNLAGAVGFGAAAEVATSRLAHFQEVAERQVRRLKTALVDLVPGAVPVLPAETLRVSNTLSMRLPGVDAEALVMHTPGVAFSAGSACTSMVPEPSHVLTAMLSDRAAAAECVRLSTGRPTTDSEIEDAALQLAAAAARVRSVSRP
jgi:cysteine desulfurase